MRMNKLVSIIATGAMAASLFAGMTFTSFADESNPWNGSTDTSWYSSSGTTFTLTDEDDLAGLASLVNGGTDFTGKTVNLNADLYLNATSVSAPSSSQRQWTPIGGGASSYSFKGTFDGQNHTIYNIYYNETSGTYSNGNTVRNNIGLFGKVEVGATVKNVNLNGGYVAAQRSVGSIAGKSWGTIEKCTSNVIVYSTDSKGVGGIVGANWVDSNHTDDPPVVNKCVFKGSVTAAYSKGSAGGIVGENEGQVFNCINAGSVASPYNAGGIVGSNKNDYNKQTQTGGTIYGGVTNSYNKGAVSGKYAGGIVGYELGSMRNCYNHGTISGVSGVTSYVGQLIGEMKSSLTHESLHIPSGTSPAGTITLGTLTLNTNYFEYMVSTSGKTALKNALNTWVGTSSIYLSWNVDDDIDDGYPYLVGLQAYL